MERLKRLALISFIIMCLAIFFAIVFVNTSTPANAYSTTVGNASVYYQTIYVKGHEFLIVTCPSGIDVEKIN
jgi:hypothetical protein